MAIKTGLYRIVLCEKVDRNGLPVNVIEPPPCDHEELEVIKEVARHEGWQVYCQGELTISELKVLQHRIK